MKKLTSATQVISRIIEVCYWVATGIMLVLFILTLIPGDLWKSMISATDGRHDVFLSTSGLEIQVLDGEGNLSRKAMSVFAIGSVPLLALGAMIFRNVHLILKTAQGQTKFSQGETPFQKDVTRMIREIGIFLLAGAALSFVIGVVAGLILGNDVASGSLSLTNIVLGLLMLCLSQVFAQGEELRRDTDGLL